MKNIKPLFFIIMFILSNVVWNTVFQGKQAFLDWGGVIFQVISCSVSVFWLITTFKKYRGAARSFWLFLGGGISSYLAGTLIFAFREFILNLDGYNRVTQFFWIGQNMLYFIALLVMMNRIRNHLFTIRFSLDMLIVMSVAMTFSWFFIFDPVLHHRAMDLSRVEILYPILDLGVLVGVVSMTITSNHIFRKAASFFLISGFLIQIVADSIYIYLKVMGRYTVGSVNEPLWILSILLIGLAGVYHLPAENADLIRKMLQKSQLFRQSIPYAGVLLLSSYVISSLYRSHPIVMGLFFSILLVIFRQMFTLIENDKLVKNLHELNEDLEVKVKERTDKLVDTLSSMEQLAFHDVVTGLPNRRYMEKRLNVAIDNRSSRKKIAFMLLDLDRFKQINDSLGHTYGDLLLKDVGKRLVAILNPHIVVCRFGGDEYAILVEDTTVEEVEEIARQVLSSLRDAYDLQGNEIHITPSIGVSLYPDDGDSFEMLLMKADTAMYKVKEKGKNHYMIYSGSMSVEPIMELERDLRKAIERNEFVLYYQPQVQTDSNGLVGFEALIRWEKPVSGLVSPAAFIPLAEETGLIVPIGEIVLREACKQSVRWEGKGNPNLRIAVNISSIQFHQKNFIPSIARIIKETGADPSKIELEITESVAMGPIEQNLEKLFRLKKMGFQIAMDDFGTGYSSLHYLSQFPIDRLKIDRSFISSWNKSEKDLAIVQLIVTMAKSLDFKVIAEGVENESQREFLRGIDCDEYQGFLFSRPLSERECEKLFKAVSPSGNLVSF